MQVMSGELRVSLEDWFVVYSFRFLAAPSSKQVWVILQHAACQWLTSLFRLYKEY